MPTWVEACVTAMVACAAPIGNPLFLLGETCENGGLPPFLPLCRMQAERLFDAFVVTVDVVANLQITGLVHPGGEVGDVDVDLGRQRDVLLRAADQLLQRGYRPALLV